MAEIDKAENERLKRELAETKRVSLEWQRERHSFKAQAEANMRRVNAVTGALQECVDAMDEVESRWDALTNRAIAARDKARVLINEAEPRGCEACGELEKALQRVKDVGGAIPIDGSPEQGIVTALNIVDQALAKKAGNRA